MCGRPPVVKGFLNVDARAGRSCHVFGLFVRPCSMAAGHNALRGLGPGHKHALKGRSGTIGLSRSVGRLAWVRYSFIALSNFVGGSSPPVRVAALYRGQPRWLKLFASRHHGPGDAGDLVGQGDGGDLGGSPAQEPDQPGMARIPDGRLDACRAIPPNADQYPITAAMGETSEITSTSSRDNRANARHIATSAMESHVP